MRKIFTNLAMILIIPALYFIFISAFTKTGSSGNESAETNTSGTDTTKFINMIMNMDRHFCDSIWVGNDSNLNMYKELGYNSVQVFPVDDSLSYGNFPYTLNSNQITNNSNLIKSVHDKGLKFFYEHVFLSYLCYAQRLVYEVPTDSGSTTANNGFCYKNVTVAPSSDSSRTVLHSVPGSNHDTALLCSGIYENLQHSDFFGRQHDDTLWYLKPMVRADLTGIDGNTPIFKIKIMNFEGDEDTSIVLKARNFRNDGIYFNNYIDKFYDGPNLTDLFISGNKTTGLNKGVDAQGTYLKLCNVDFKIYTYGYVDFYFDKLTVDDDYAHKLFNPDPNKNYDYILQNSLQYIGNDPNLFSYYMDEVTYSQLPCVKYVMDKISAYPNIKFMVSEANWMNANHTRSGNLGHGPMLSLLQPRVLNTFIYEFYNYSYGNVWYPPLIPGDAIGLGNIDPGFNNDWITNTNSYNKYLQDSVFGDKNSSLLDTYKQGSFVHQVFLAKDAIIKKSQSTLLYITPQIQGEMYMNNGNLENIREPLNEEIEAQTMLALSHGADGLINYIFQSKHWQATQPMNFHYLNTQSPFPTTSTDFYTFSLFGRFSDSDSRIKREHNLYGQNKWEFMKKMNAKINKWIPTLDKINWLDGFSVHSEGATHYFINNIQSLYASTNGGTPICEEDNIWADCNDEKYWEEAFFSPKNTTDNSKYFLMTNRRCAPEVAGINLGDLRRLKIYFMASQLTGFNNWKIINVENDSVLNTFDKNAQTYFNIGTFQPGEGKLFKLAPVMQEGGTLAGNETFSGNTTCNGMIYGNGHNITISPNTTITFDSLAGIEMNGGIFTCGDNSSANTNVILKGKDNNTNTWNGLVLSNCSSIGIYRTNISKIIANDTAKAVLISNCNNINISNTSFSMGTNAGAIQAVFTTTSINPAVFNVSNCSFEMGNSSYSAISIISNASYSLPLIIEWCSFNSSNDTTNALLLSGVTGGAIKNNLFLNFNSTINTLGSAIDLYNNTILGKDNSTGIFCVDGSSISLSPNSGQYLGGYNYIRNYGISASNIHSISSTFNIDAGQNDFDLNDIDNSKHFTGTFSGQQQLSVNAIKNCFHKDSITNIDATHSVVWNGSTDPVNFIFTDYSCELTPPGDYFVYQYGGYNDTVYYRSGGEGGGVNPNKQISIEENVYKSLKDTININLRKRNYLTVEDKAKLLLTQFPDSLESSGMVQKLYMASLSLDSTKIGITKTFLENLITSNAQNPTLIKRAFYFIQKCKVKLGQYQSALDGFQYIMTQNPYTYEGLVASWDYAATYLLMGSGGSYNGDIEVQSEELNTPADTLLNRMTKRDINTNKSTNTNSNNTSIEQITKTFYEKIKNVTKDDKSIQEAKIKTLEKKIETTKNKSEKNEAKRELATMKQINEVVKVKKPNTVMTHVAILNNDIKKVFGKGSKDESKNNLIPTTYTLYQNYPNPFNPVTKIAYDIPRDAKVKLVIYDILGREMKTLVNNEFRSAGKYITEFNGSYLASGIYFARILVNEGKDFIAVKKLVLLK